MIQDNEIAFRGGNSRISLQILSEVNELSPMVQFKGGGIRLVGQTATVLIGFVRSF